MTPRQPTTLNVGPLVGRVMGVGLLVAAVLVAVALLLASPELRAMILAGAGLALVAGALGTWILAAGACQPGSDPRAGTAFLRGLVLDFALQFGLIIAAMLGLRAAEVKFAELAAFGITFAALAMVLHLLGAVMISRRLQQRSDGLNTDGLNPSTTESIPQRLPQGTVTE